MFEAVKAAAANGASRPPLPPMGGREEGSAVDGRTERGGAPRRTQSRGRAAWGGSAEQKSEAEHRAARRGYALRLGEALPKRGRRSSGTSRPYRAASLPLGGGGGFSPKRAECRRRRRSAVATVARKVRAPFRKTSPEAPLGLDNFLLV